MKSVLKEFYRGNFVPCNREFENSGTAKMYRELLQKQETVYKRLEASLDTQQVKDFQAYCALQAQMEVEEQEELFLYAFRLGARWERELFSRRTDGIVKEPF